MEYPKVTNPSMLYVAKYVEEKTFLMQVGAYLKHPLNGYDLTLKADDGEDFSFTTRVRPPWGVQKISQYKIPQRSCLILRSKDSELHVRPNAFRVTKADFDHDSEDVADIVEGRISELSNRPYSFYKTKRYYRLILPADAFARIAGDIECHSITEGRSWQLGLLNICIAGIELQFFEKTVGDKKCFFIDCLTKTTIDEFKHTYRTVFVAYAFLFGKYYGKEGAILSYKSKKLDEPQSVLYYTYGREYKTGFPIHSSNFYPYIKPKLIKNDEGITIEHDYSAGKKLCLEWFRENDFDKLCNLIHDKKGIGRALDLYISTFSAPLEIMVPTYFIILEHITFSLSGKPKETLSIITDPGCKTSS